MLVVIYYEHDTSQGVERMNQRQVVIYYVPCAVEVQSRKLRL